MKPSIRIKDGKWWCGGIGAHRAYVGGHSPADAYRHWRRWMGEEFKAAR